MAALAKTIGAILAILGVLLLLAGLGAAAYGFYDMDKHRNDLFRDSDREEADQALMMGGAAAASTGLVLFLAGLITLLASRPKQASPTTPNATTSSSAAAQGATASPAPRDTNTRNAILAATIAVVLVGLVLAGIFLSDTENAREFFQGSGSSEPTIVFNKTYEGTVQGGSTGLPGAEPVNLGDSSGQFTPPAEATACTARLDWTPTSNGAAQLRLLVQRDGKTVADLAGAPGFTVVLDPVGLAGAAHDFEVFPPQAPGVVSQAFSLKVICTDA